MAKALTSEKIRIRSANGARASFLALDKPVPFAAGMAPKWKATFLLDPSDKEHAAIIADIKAKAAKLLADAGLKREDLTHPPCFGDGSKKKYDGWSGMFYISSAQDGTSYVPVVNRTKVPVKPGNAQFPYSGCYINGSITLWLQNNSYGKRINANLLTVQFVRDGEAFGGGERVDPDDEFEALGDAPGGSGSSADPFGEDDAGF